MKTSKVELIEQSFEYIRMINNILDTIYGEYTGP